MQTNSVSVTYIQNKHSVGTGGRGGTAIFTKTEILNIKSSKIVKHRLQRTVTITWDPLLDTLVLTFCLGLLSRLGLGLSWGSFLDLSLLYLTFDLAWRPSWSLWVSVGSLFSFVSLLVSFWGSLKLSLAVLVSLGLSWACLGPLVGLSLALLGHFSQSCCSAPGSPTLLLGVLVLFPELSYSASALSCSSPRFSCSVPAVSWSAPGLSCLAGALLTARKLLVCS